MISRRELINIAKLYNRRPWQQEKHYIQTLILIALSEEPLIFKGGTYLWFFHGLSRFSEDLDFTVEKDLIGTLPRKVSHTLNLFGVENTFKITTNLERAFTFRISSKGPLNTSDADLCHVYVEISKREKIILNPLSLTIKTEPYQTPQKFIKGLNLQEVAAEKVRAILTRDKARDIYDLWFLMEKGFIPSRKEIDEKMSYYKQPFETDRLEQKIREKKKIWAGELKSLVSGPLPDFELVATKILQGLIKT